jgi:hypothetical protein
MPTNLVRARFATAAVGALLLVGIAGCGSSSDDDSSTDTTAAGAVDDTTSDATSTEGDTEGGDEEATAVDPCQWYTAEAMSTLVGFEVTMEQVETPQALGVECLYNSDAEFTSITVRPTTAADYDQLKAGAASMGLDEEQFEVTGVGDEAYHTSAPDDPNPSVSLSAKQGDDAIQVELAAASGGPIATVDQGVEITTTIATTALG